MKLCIRNADSLKDALNILASDIGIELSCECQSDVIVDVKEAEEHIVEVSLDGKTASITYGGGKVRFFRGLAMLVNWIKNGENVKSVTEKPIFTMNGGMLDVSRNAVMNVKYVKYMLRKQALMGLNTFMLYTEDTYEIDNHPYFGYMRGRYTKDEMKELDKYALELGIELIPCVQMLGHLATHLKWTAAAAYKDTENALLVGADATYELIEDMLKTIDECFTTKRLHIGMDETKDVGIGKYLTQNGYRERQDIYLEHLGRVVELCNKYGFKPMMWSDMFFRLAGKDLEKYGDYDVRVEISPEVIKCVPDGVQQIFWDYYRTNEEFYAVNLEKHKAFGDDTIFAGGIWTWNTYSLIESYLEKKTLPALEACRKAGTKEIFATIWNSGGGNAALITSLAGLAWYASYDYNGGHDAEKVRECFKFSCDQNYDDFAKLEMPEHVPAGFGGTWPLVFNDPLIGLIDKNIEGNDLGAYFRNVSAELEGVGDDSREFVPCFDMIKKLSSLLENKADFGVRLKAAYDAKDSKQLAALASECDIIESKLNALRDSHEASWMEYHKAFGWEVYDFRYGGEIMRIKQTKQRILKYLAGQIDAIEELEAERLRYSGGRSLASILTANRLLY